jgi:hypothetical protein
MPGRDPARCFKLRLPSTGAPLRETQPARQFRLQGAASIARPIMNFAALGILVASKRDARSLVQYSFGLPQGSEDQVLSELLTNMSDGTELSVLDPTNGDCALEAKRKGIGYEIKRGCHGAYGT